MSKYKPENIKEVLIAILIGAGVSFFATIFQELANWLSNNSEQITAALASAGYYLAKQYRV